MDRIDVFYQREGNEEQLHIETDAAMSLSDLRTLLVNKHGLDAAVVIFIDDLADRPSICTVAARSLLPSRSTARQSTTTSRPAPPSPG
jgi:hypothetical protein